MKKTPETIRVLDGMVSAANFLNAHCTDTGYQIKRRDYPDGEYTTLCIRKPADTEWAAYPEVYYSDDFYGTETIRFEIATVGYGDHSLAQAERTIHGLVAATELVKTLYATAEAMGFKTQR